MGFSKAVTIPLTEITGDIRKILAVGGGSVNQTFKVIASKGEFFVKLNHAKAYPGMFDVEARALGLLTQNSGFKVPQVLGLGEVEDTSFLVLEWIPPGRNSPEDFFIAGKTLAGLHKSSAARFGLSYNNYIGYMPQSNKEHDNWPGFFQEERLEPMLVRAIEEQRLKPALRRNFENLYLELPDIFPAEVPSLLHGDLWNGNFMFTSDGAPSVFDPAVYFGHREMDLAMSRLFGGFPEEFYQGYQEIFPLEKDWGKRVDICNLYPLLVHVNLFGGSYAGQVEGIVRKF